MKPGSDEQSRTRLPGETDDELTFAHHSVGAMKPTMLLSCSFFTMPARSLLATLLGETRTRYSPPGDGPSAMVSLLVSRKLLTSAAFACGRKRISAKAPSTLAASGIDAV